MKQLKFMLAAATAFGIATAQAATEELDNETFTYPDTQVVTEIDGFSFEGAAGDNESAIVNNALKVNTGTDPLLRQLNTKYGEAIDLTAEGLNSLSIDTKVKFTVTPEGDDVTATAGDKLMIYLKEVPEVKDGDEVVSAATTKLMVKAAKYSEADGAWVEGGDDYEVTLPVAIESVTADTWYRLIVKTKAYAYGFDDEGVANSWWPVFQIYLASATDDVIDDADLCKMGDVDGSGYGAAGIDTGDDEADSVFVSLAVSAADGEGAGSSALSLTKVGFAGEGTIDDFVVTKDYVATTVDFTFTWTTDGISAVTYAIGDATEYTSLGEDKKIAGLAPDAIIKIQITPDDWYAVKDDADLEYTASEGSAGLDDLVTVVTTKVDPDTGDVVVNPGESVTVADIQAAAGITEGAFFAEGTTKADLEKVLTWKNKNNANGKADINKITFSGVEPTSSEAEAYLLNCAPTEDAIKAKKDAFVFSAFTFDENGAPVVTIDPEFAGDVNGRIEIRGATSLDAEDAFTAPKKDGDAFFKAFLVK